VLTLRAGKRRGRAGAYPPHSLGEGASRRPGALRPPPAALRGRVGRGREKGRPLDPAGFAAGTQGEGKKRPVRGGAVGLGVHAIVPPANIQGRGGGTLLLTARAERVPRSAQWLADAAGRGPHSHRARATPRPRLTTAIAIRGDRRKGVVWSSPRGSVARALAWRHRCRRLAQDVETRPRYAVAFVHLAAIRLRGRKLCNPP
jgi:hypothetical protein